MKKEQQIVSDIEILEKEETLEKAEVEQAQNDLADWLGWE
jgi:hypothetical protein